MTHETELAKMQRMLDDDNCPESQKQVIRMLLRIIKQADKLEKEAQKLSPRCAIC